MSTAEDLFYKNAQASEDKSEPAPWESRLISVPPDWYTTAPPPRKWLLTDARTEVHEGVFPLGKVGLLAAEGGAGKTMAVVQLALSVATGRPWLGTFTVPKAGKVLIILGEEDAEEVHRRIYRAVRMDDGGLPPEGSIVILPLAGITCPMIEDGEDGAFLVWLREYVRETGPYALIVPDPISRFYGKDAEKDNAAGTRFCQALESLVEPSGGASVLGSHHVNKNSRGTGATVDASSARGSSAITDGMRWVATIGVENIEDGETVLTFAVPKTNYSKKPPPLEMHYSDGGVLVPLDESDRENVEKARNEADPRARRERKREEVKATRNADIDEVVIACVTGKPGIGSTDLRTNVKAKANCGPDAADTAIARMIQAGRIRRTEGKTKEHHIVEPDVSAKPETTNGVNGTGMTVDDGPPYSFADV